MRTLFGKIVLSSVLLVVATANAQIDRDAATTIKRNFGSLLPPSSPSKDNGQGVPGLPSGVDIVTGIEQLGVIPALTPPADHTAQLNDSYSFVARGTFSSDAFLEPESHDKFLPTSLVGTMKLDGAGHVTSSHIDTGPVRSSD